MPIDIYLGIFIFILGLMVGSFLNVVIYRVPNEISIIKPNSRCGECNTTLKWYDMIPVVSLLLLKGRCRYCNTRISYRYSFVEILTGVITVLLYITYGISFEFIFFLSLIYILIPCFFIDLDHMIIPNGLVITGSVLFIIGFTYKLLVIKEGLIDHLIGGLAGGGIMLLIYFLGLLIYKKEALGFGDVKLFFVIGLFLGLKLTAIAFLYSIFSGALIGIIIMVKTKKKGKTEMPFGPFIVLGSILSLFIGNMMYNWYMGFF